MFLTRDEITAALLAETNGQIDVHSARIIADAAEPGVWLEASEISDDEKVPIGASKLGGLPDVPPDFAWPIRKSGAEWEDETAVYHGLIKQLEENRLNLPEERIRAQIERNRQMIEYIRGDHLLHFVGQFSLEDVAGGRLPDHFPAAGILSVFYETIIQPWGFRPSHRHGFRLFHFPDVYALRPADYPSELDEHPEPGLLPERRLVSHACIMPVPPKTTSFKLLGLPEPVCEAYAEWWDDDERMTASHSGLDWKCHRIGGWPTPIQGDMQAEAAAVCAGFDLGSSGGYRDARAAGALDKAPDWRLLLQIGSDDQGVMWGDLGQLYIWIDRSNLVARRFEAAHLVLQCS